MKGDGSSSGFHTTRWTLVRHATGQSPAGRQALSDLCAGCYRPVVAFLRREGREEDAARDLAHEFFRRLLEKPSFGGAEEVAGRFRSYLLGALKHFLAHERERAGRQKRGGGAESISLDAGTDTSPGLELLERYTLPPDAWFDRQWALAILDRALAALASEQESAGQAAEFARLKPWLTGDAEHGEQAATARACGMSAGSLKVAVHRLRRRFRHLVKAEIAQTLDARENIDEEMRCLLAALSRS